MSDAAASTWAVSAGGMGLGHQEEGSFQTQENVPCQSIETHGWPTAMVELLKLR
jgi:hypothetical protein